LISTLIDLNLPASRSLTTPPTTHFQVHPLVCHSANWCRPDVKDHYKAPDHLHTYDEINKDWEQTKPDMGL